MQKQIGQEKKAKKSVPRIVLTTIVYVVLALVFLWSALAVLRPDSKPFVFGYRWFHIASGSMEPELPVGSLIMVEKVESVHDLKVDDVITYKITRNGTSTTITHRIVGIVEKDGEISFSTKGDAADLKDSYFVEFKDIYGKYTGKRIGLVGFAFGFFSSAQGLICLAIITLLVLFSGFIGDKINERIEDEDKKKGMLADLMISLKELSQETAPQTVQAGFDGVQVLHSPQKTVEIQEKVTKSVELIEKYLAEKPIEEMAKEIFDEPPLIEVTDAILALPQNAGEDCHYEIGESVQMGLGAFTPIDNRPVPKEDTSVQVVEKIVYVDRIVEKVVEKVVEKEILVEKGTLKRLEASHAQVLQLQEGKGKGRAARVPKEKPKENPLDILDEVVIPLSEQEMQEYEQLKKKQAAAKKIERERKRQEKLQKLASLSQEELQKLEEQKLARAQKRKQAQQAKKQQEEEYLNSLSPHQREMYLLAQQQKQDIKKHLNRLKKARKQREEYQLLLDS